jgi:ABC-type transporter Mla MlaB component
MPIILDQSEEVITIRLLGEVDISCAIELRALLLTALGSKKKLRLELEETCELDVTTLQLLWAAEREARSCGVKFTVEQPLPQAVSRMVADAGFEKFPLPANS